MAATILSKSLENMFVVSLDDDPYINDLVTTRLNEIKIKNKTYTDPEFFLKSFVAENPDLCLLDLNLGKEGLGFLVLKALRKVIGNKIPIVIISARDDSDDIACAFEFGANDYMVKPFRKNEFQEKIKQILLKSDEFEQLQYFYNVPDRFNQCYLKLSTSVIAVKEDMILIESPYLLKKGNKIDLDGDLLKHLGLTPPYPKIKGTIVKNNLNSQTSLFETVVKIDFFQDDLQHKFINFFESASDDSVNKTKD